MALLSNAERNEINRTIQQVLSDNNISIALTKAELRAAIDGTDEWIDNNAALYNMAIPIPARTVLTTNQKVQLLMYVITKRREMGV